MQRLIVLLDLSPSYNRKQCVQNSVSSQIEGKWEKGDDDEMFQHISYELSFDWWTSHEEIKKMEDSSALGDPRRDPSGQSREARKYDDGGANLM